MFLFTFLQYRIANMMVLLFAFFFVTRRYNRRISCLFIAIVFILSTLLDIVMMENNMDPMHLIFFTVLQILLTQGGIFLLCKYRDFRTLFTGFSIAVYTFIGCIFGVASYYYTQSIFLSLFIEFCIVILILLLLLRYLRNVYLAEQQLREHGWLPMCLIPALFYTALYTLTSYPGNVHKTPANIVTVFVLLVMMVVAYILMFRILNAQRRDDALLRNNELLETYAKRMERENEILQKAEFETAMLRHDMRHHVRIMAAYLKANQLDLLEQAFAEVDETIAALKPEQYCENAAINSLLAHSATQAKQYHIAFTSQVDIPKTLPVSDFEFSTVLSNLLENALRATAKIENPAERCVQIHAHRTKNRLILEVSNSFTGTLRFDPDTGLPLSANGEGHGYGLRSVIAFAQKYDAAFDYSTENHCFFARLLLNGF